MIQMILKYYESDVCRNMADELNLDLKNIGRDGLTDEGKLRFMNNIWEYLPLGSGWRADVGVLILEAAMDFRGYERREGCSGKFVATWLADKLDER